MKLDNEVVSDYISYFFSKIVGFKSQVVKYVPIGQGDNEFLSIAMDKIDTDYTKKWEASSQGLE